MSWEPLNLALIEKRPPIRPTLGTLGLLYPGRRHVYSGMTESGKTIAAYIDLIAVARGGGRAILIDFEMGPWDALERLRDLGATDQDLERILYIEPTTSATPEIIAGLVALDPALVVIDASLGAFELSQLDDNRRQDVEVFARLYVNAFWAAGIATAVIDHVGKVAENRGRYAIGSERKIGGTDVHLGFEAIKAPHRGGTGLLKISVHKDRFGHLPRPTVGTLPLDSDPDSHRITWTLEHTTDDESTGTTWQPTVLMGRVVEYLTKHPEPASRNTIERSVKGRAEYIRQAIDILLNDGTITETKGPGAARLYTLVPSSRPRPSLVPDEPVRTSSPRPTPYRGDEDEDELGRLLREHADIANGTNP